MVAVEAYEKQPSTNAQILVVEDDRPIQKMVEALLASNGHHVDAVDSGEEGLEAMQTHPYSLVLTDLMLPGMTGDEMLKKRWEYEIANNLPHTPAIIMTATPEHISRMRNDGTPVLAKPFEIDHLLDLVEKQIRLMRSIPGESPIQLPIKTHPTRQPLNGK